MSVPDHPPLCWPNGKRIRRGQRVRTKDTVRPSKYAGREGTVGRVLATITEAGRVVWVGEVGVSFGGDRLAWFRPDELVRVVAVTGLQKAPTGGRAEVVAIR